MAENSSKLPIIVIVVLIIAAGLGYYMYNKNQTTPSETLTNVESTDSVYDTTEDTDVETMDTTSMDEGEMEGDETTTETDMADAGDETADSSASQGSIDVEQALAVRSMGSEDAPVVIREHSSFTCGHCGDFHRNTFDQIKSEYIDTGKVRLIFTDFPLDGRAVHAGMVARCLPEGRYFDFVELLFKNQDKWAYESNYMNYLRQNAALAGLGNAEFDACINNEELQEGITSRMREAQQKYSISSTPTLVFNEDNVVTGSRSFEFFKDVIEKELAEAGE